MQKIPTVRIGVKSKKDGSKIYFLDYTVDGVRTRNSVGSSKREAELAKAELIQQFKNDTYNLKPSSTVLDQLVAQYLNSKKLYISKRTTSRYSVLLEAFTTFINTYFKEVAANAGNLKPQMILKFLDYCINDLKWNSKTTNMSKALVNSVYLYGINENLISINPFSKVKNLPEVSTTKLKFYSHEELKAIFDALPKFWKEFFQVLYLTGMRKDELVNLKFSNIDFNLGVITIQNDEGYTTKTKVSRTIPMHPDVKEILIARQLEGGVYCFSTSVGTKVGVDKPYNNLKKVLNKLKIKGDVHQFRHTFASHLVMSGVSLMTVSELLGHSDIKTTMIYAHLSPDFKAKAISNLTLRF